MKNFALPKGLVELKTSEMEKISGGNGIAFRFGQAFHHAYCFIRDWAKDYEGNPTIKLKMGGL